MCGIRHSAKGQISKVLGPFHYETRMKNLRKRTHIIDDDSEEAEEFSINLYHPRTLSQEATRQADRIEQSEKRSCWGLDFDISQHRTRRFDTKEKYQKPEKLFFLGELLQTLKQMETIAITS